MFPDELPAGGEQIEDGAPEPVEAVSVLPTPLDPNQPKRVSHLKIVK